MNRRNVSHYLLFGLTLLLGGCATSTSLMAVNVPVVDVRKEPRAGTPSGAHDPLQETQLLYGEKVHVNRVSGSWAQVEALEQPEFTHGNRWQGYPGWVRASSLIPWEPLREPTIVVTARWAQGWLDAHQMRSSPWRFAFGTRLRAVDIGGQLWRVELLDGSRVWFPYEHALSLDALRALPPAQKRTMILKHAQWFVGDRYFWGGRSPGAAKPASQAAAGVDCSGLVNLAYRSVGVDIPRDAHEQFLRARPVGRLRPGDLVFLSEADNPKRIAHVMLYAGEDHFIEAPGTGLAVRRISSTQRLGQSADQLKTGQSASEQTVYLGSYLP